MDYMVAATVSVGDRVVLNGALVAPFVVPTENSRCTMAYIHTDEKHHSRGRAANADTGSIA
jgi:hypothetical protein